MNQRDNNLRPQIDAPGAFEFEAVPAATEMWVHDRAGLGLLLPSGSTDSSDEQLPQPPLSIGISRAELEELTHPQRPIAVTRYGPEDQDKASNQDFALSAVIRGHNGEPWVFAAIADGVSNKTFWPERSARIACLSAYKLVSEWVRCGRIDREGEHEKLQLEQARRLTDDFKRDRERLLDDDLLEPSTYVRSEYQKHRGEDRFWYNTTLLVAALGPRFGLVWWVGDGGICLQKQKESTSRVYDLLRSPDTSQLEAQASIGTPPSKFAVRRIRNEGLRSLRLVFSSDGIDRELRKHVADDYEPLISSQFAFQEPHREALVRTVDSLIAAERPEPDNQSIAAIEWARDARWESWRQPRLGRIRASVGQPSHPDTAPDALRPESLSAEQPAVPDHSESQPPNVNHQELPTSSSLHRRTTSRRVPSDEPESDKTSHPERDPDPNGISRVLPSIAFILIPLVALLAGVALGRVGHGAPVGSVGQPGDEIEGDLRPAVEASAQPSFGVVPPANEGAEQAPDETPKRRDLRRYQLRNEGDVQKALDAEQERMNLALFELLMDWKHAVDKHGLEGSHLLTVVAYADRDLDWRNKSVIDCQYNREKSGLRARRIAGFLQQVTAAPSRIRHTSAVCSPPPGVTDVTSPSARSLMLVSGAPIVGCDCTAGYTPTGDTS